MPLRPELRRLRAKRKAEAETSKPGPAAKAKAAPDAKRKAKQAKTAKKAWLITWVPQHAGFSLIWSVFGLAMWTRFASRDEKSFCLNGCFDPPSPQRLHQRQSLQIATRHRNDTSARSDWSSWTACSELHLQRSLHLSHPTFASLWFLSFVKPASCPASILLKMDSTPKKKRKAPPDFTPQKVSKQKNDSELQLDLALNASKKVYRSSFWF